MKTTKQEISDIIKKLEQFKDYAGSEAVETILAEAAEPAKLAMVSAAPQSKKRHVIKERDGNIKSVSPGNLKRSIQIFKPKGVRGKSSQKVGLVGPVMGKKARIKKLKGGPKVSKAKRAFYSQFVIYGSARQAPNRFIDKARSQSSGAVLSKLKSGITKYLDKEIQKLF